MRVSANIFGIVAAVLFAVALLGELGAIDGVDVSAFTLGGLICLALGGVIVIDPRP